MSDFNQHLTEALPHLRRFALKLTRTEDQAEDLVQDCVERALRKKAFFQAGTNMRAWMFTMMRNQFINGTRRAKVAYRYEENLRANTSRSAAPVQVTQIFLNQTLYAMRGLGEEERDAMRLIAIEERSHQEAADTTDQAVGTMKSRLFRARAKLRAKLEVGEDGVFSGGDELDAA